jgi:hypothetical protein
MTYILYPKQRRKCPQAALYADVSRMLEECARGSTVRLATHSQVVTYGGRVYRSLPKFDKIELGHIRKMIRHLSIDLDCARRHLPI